MILINVFILLATLWCWHRWTKRRVYSFASKVPTGSPPPLPVIGQTYLGVLGYKEISRRLLEILFRKVLNENNIVCLWTPVPYFIIKGVEDIQKLLSNATVERTMAVKLLGCFLGDGLLTAEEDVARVKRSFYQSVFKTKNVEAFMPRLNKNCLTLVAKLSEYVSSETVDVYPFVLNTNLQSLCNVIYGDKLEFDCESEDFKNLLRAVMRIPKIGLERLLKLWLRPNFIFNFVYKKEINHIFDIFKTFNERSLKEANARRSKWSADDQSNTPTDESNNVRNTDQSESEFINFLKVFNNLQKENPEILHEKSLLHEIITLCTAGTDTSAIFISSSFLLLGYHPHVQEKLFDEIVSVVGMERDVTVQDLDKMPYMNVVCKEVLRWASPIGAMSRKSTKDVKLSSSTIPPGCEMDLSIIGLNNDSKTFPEPRKFDPDRFLPENREGCNRYDFLPFGAGPRNCIGKTYATVLGKVAIIQVLRNFKIITSLDINNITWKYSVILISDEGYPVHLQPRSNC